MGAKETPPKRGVAQLVRYFAWLVVATAAAGVRAAKAVNYFLCASNKLQINIGRYVKTCAQGPPRELALIDGLRRGCAIV